jgi:NADH dehydrogenase FAD-containing subunit
MIDPLAAQFASLIQNQQYEQLQQFSIQYPQQYAIFYAEYMRQVSFTYEQIEEAINPPPGPPPDELEPPPPPPPPPAEPMSPSNQGKPSLSKKASSDKKAQPVKLLETLPERNTGAKNNPLAGNGAPRLVIVGTGMVGWKIADKLQAQLLQTPDAFQFTIIDQREYFENNVAALRCAVTPWFHKDVTRPHLSWLNDQRMLVVGTVTEVQEKCVLVETNKGMKKVPFDVVIICTGTSYPHFKTDARFREMDSRFRYFQDMAESIQLASSVLVVGGGATGVEMVGEIRHSYPDKPITIVHKHQNLLHDCPIQQSLKTQALLQERKINIILEDALIYDTPVNPFDENKFEVARRTYRTKKGQKVEADLLIRCVNGKPNTQCLRKNFSHVLQKSGKVSVRPTLQILTHENVFIAGDIVDMPNCQLVVNLTDMPDVIVTNALDVLRGRHAYKNFVPGTASWPNSISIGPSDAVGGSAVMFGMVSTGTSLAKNTLMKDLPPDKTYHI